MPNPLLSAFKFEAKLRRSAQIVSGSNLTVDPNATPSGTSLGDGAFQECSGLEVEMDVQQYLEGGRNDGAIQRVGRAKYTNIVLKRGMFYSQDGQVNAELWDWLQNIVSGNQVVRYDGIVRVNGRSKNGKAPIVAYTHITEPPVQAYYQAALASTLAPIREAIECRWQALNAIPSLL